MKKFDLLTPLVNSLLSFLTALAGIGCLCTAFSLDVSPGLLLFACLFWAAATTAALQIRHGWIALPVLLALWGWIFWDQGLAGQSQSLLSQLFSYYRSAYGWDLPPFLTATMGREVTVAVAALGSICAILSAMGLQSRWAPGTLIAALIPLVPCLIVTDTPPSPAWLFVWLLCVVLVVLPQTVRQADPRRAARLVALLLIPALLLCGTLFVCYPQSQHHASSDAKTFREKLLDTIDELPFLLVDDSGQIFVDLDDIPQVTVPSFMLSPNVPNITITPTIPMDPGILDVFQNQVSLENAGPRNPLDISVMTISTRLRSGTLYLRGQGYDVYSGTSWQISDIPQELFVRQPYLKVPSSVTITTSWVHNRRFLPCYPHQDVFTLNEGRIENEDQATTYTFSAAFLQDDWQQQWHQEFGSSIHAITENIAFTTLPDETLQQAQSLVAALGITRDTDVVEAAMRIRDYVRSSATYDLNTPSMPEDAQDFVLWFLQESDTGYCVHFASAATVLLRAAGIPARYVEGYMTPISWGETDVSEADAHAWVEYFVPGVGWVIMEATPSGGNSPVLPDETRPTVPTGPTEPTTVPGTSTAPTVPTIPTKPTQPTTVPGTSTAPTIPTKPTQPSTVPGTSTAPTVPGTSTAPTEPSQTTTPAVPPPDVEQPKRPGLWASLGAVLLLLTGICALVGQWQLRLWLKFVWLQRGDANRRAVALWWECRRLAKLRRQRAPYALRDLAWKAKFSQHTITEDELQEFTAYLQRSVDHLRKRPWYLQLIYRLIFAAY